MNARDPQPVRIEVADPLGAEALRLLQEAAAEARSLYPEAFTPDSPPPTNTPTPPRGVYFVARVGGEAVGMGAHRPYDAHSTEIRRMFVTRAARRSGAARALLAALEQHALAAGFSRLVLETGNRQRPAMQLYEAAGFHRIDPFGPYVGDPLSVCFEKRIGPGHPGAAVPGDPFVHLPHLRERLTPAQASTLRLTPEGLAEWDRRAIESGRSADWRLPDEVREAGRRAFLASLGGPGDLWVFGYGSLMWDPGFHFREVRSARVAGYRRRFTLKSPGGRGSPACPCLFLTLEPGPGECTGLAFRLAAPTVEDETTFLWRREMVAGSYAPALCAMDTPQGPIQAVLFASNPASPNYCAEMPLAQTAAMIAAASGPLGTNRAYLEQVHAQLHALQVRDDYIAALSDQVAALGRPAVSPSDGPHPPTAPPAGGHRPSAAG